MALNGLFLAIESRFKYLCPRFLMRVSFALPYQETPAIDIRYVFDV